ncbi:hypothetical protein HDU96_000981 [Phlyctochytrium bullatum]|nr:hypothetical protein HDU96_000981 [Phlyctochytrium bullatum]
MREATTNANAPLFLLLAYRKGVQNPENPNRNVTLIFKENPSAYRVSGLFEVQGRTERQGNFTEESCLRDCSQTNDCQFILFDAGRNSCTLGAASTRGNVQSGFVRRGPVPGVRSTTTTTIAPATATSVPGMGSSSSNTSSRRTTTTTTSSASSSAGGAQSGSTNLFGSSTSVIGIAAGGAAAILLIIGIAIGLAVMRKRRRNRQAQQQPNGKGAFDPPPVFAPPSGIPPLAKPHGRHHPDAGKYEPAPVSPRSTRSAGPPSVPAISTSRHAEATAHGDRYLSTVPMVQTGGNASVASGSERNTPSPDRGSSSPLLLAPTELALAMGAATTTSAPMRRGSVRTATAMDDDGSDSPASPVLSDVPVATLPRHPSLGSIKTDAAARSTAGRPRRPSNLSPLAIPAVPALGETYSPTGGFMVATHPQVQAHMGYNAYNYYTGMYNANPYGYSTAPRAYTVEQYLASGWTMEQLQRYRPPILAASDAPLSQ